MAAFQVWNGPDYLATDVSFSGSWTSLFSGWTETQQPPDLSARLSLQHGGETTVVSHTDLADLPGNPEIPSDEFIAGFPREVLGQSLWERMASFLWEIAAYPTAFRDDLPVVLPAAVSLSDNTVSVRLENENGRVYRHEVSLSEPAGEPAYLGIPFTVAEAARTALHDQS